MHIDWRSENKVNIVSKNRDILYKEIALDFLRLAEQCQSNKGIFSVILGGGNTPKSINSYIVGYSSQISINWDNVYIFFTDERCVEMTHIDSNYRMIYESLTSQLSIPGRNVYRIKGEKNLDDAINDYQQDISDFFNRIDRDGFDLSLIGVGQDSHTASLFPFSDSLNEFRLYVVYGGKGPEGFDRISVTYPVINSSKNIWVLGIGEEKKDLLNRILSSEFNPDKFPIQGIYPAFGKMIYWMTK
jgi:6-phosphogluconolactonase